MVYTCKSAIWGMVYGIVLPTGFCQVWGILSVGYTMLMFWRLSVPVLVTAVAGLFLSLCHSTRKGRKRNGEELRPRYTVYVFKCKYK